MSRSIIFKKEYDFSLNELAYLKNAYRQMFRRMYGPDLSESFSRVTNTVIEEELKNKLIKFNENEQRANDAVIALKNDLCEKVLIYEDELLIGVGRIEIKNDTAFINEILISFLPEDELVIVWEEVLKKIEEHYYGYKFIYVQIPYGNPKLLFRADNLGYKESPEYIIQGEITKNYTYSKKLER